MTDTPIAEVGARGGREAAHSAAARTMFDRIAPTYDLLNRLISVGLDERWRARAVAALEGAPAGRVLDLCSGTLDLSARLKQARPGQPVVAVDFSEGMLEAGKTKAPGVELVVADAMALPFEDGAMAAVVCGFGMRNLADLSAGMREVRRVLRPGGVFVTLELFRAVRPATRALHRGYARILVPIVGACVSGDGGAYRYLARSMAGFLTRAEYQAALRGQGFARVEGFDLTFGVASVVRAEAAA